MRRKFLVMMLVSLSVVLVSVVAVLAFKQQAATIRSFSEQQNTLVEFAVDNFELALSSGQLAAVNRTLDRLQSYSIFEGAMVFDAEMTHLIVRPEGFEVPPPLIEQLQQSRKVTEAEISYEVGVLTDEDGEVIGSVLIAFTLAPVKAESRQAMMYAVALGFLILLPMVGIVAWQINRMIKPLDLVMTAIQRITTGDVDQHIDYQSRDEIGSLAKAFRKLIDYIKGIASAADRLSKGDPTVDVVPRSERDVLSHSFNRMAQNLIRQREHLEEQVALRTAELQQLSNKLAKYLSPQVYASIFSGEQSVEIASKRKKLTVFFSDIANFTETTDSLESEELTNLLNRYLTEMSKIAIDHGATIDKYVGDAIIAFFGDPESRGVKEDARTCVNMAIAMQRRMQELQSEWLEKGLERPFRVRIGINTGFCTVGNFGSEARMDYTIIGNEVNLAARLESHAKVGGILMAHETHSLVKDTIMAEEGDALTVKGFAKTTWRRRAELSKRKRTAFGF